MSIRPEVALSRLMEVTKETKDPQPSLPPRPNMVHVSHYYAEV
jgi:hypothetical protein